jgi:hypothetical protein
VSICPASFPSTRGEGEILRDGRANADFANRRSAIWCRNSRRGEIFLEDDEKAPLGGKKSFCLHPASTKCTTSLGSVKEDGEKAAVEEYHD